jgi:hypothetical protein
VQASVGSVPGLISLRRCYILFLVLNKLFIIKFIHSTIFWWQVFCLSYLLFACIFRIFNVLTLIGIASILINGILLLANKGRCPFTTLAENQGAGKGSVTDIFLPDCIARNIFRVSFPFFITELIVLAARYFTGL